MSPTRCRTGHLGLRRIKPLRCSSASLRRRATAERFDVSPSSVIKLMQRSRQTRDYARGGERKRKLAGQEGRLYAVLAAEQDITLAELQRRLASEKALQDLAAHDQHHAQGVGLQLQKTSRAAEQDRPDIRRKRRLERLAAVTEARSGWRSSIETAAKTNMACAAVARTANPSTPPCPLATEGPSPSSPGCTWTVYMLPCCSITRSTPMPSEPTSNRS